MLHYDPKYCVAADKECKGVSIMKLDDEDKKITEIPKDFHNILFTKSEERAFKSLLNHGFEKLTLSEFMVLDLLKLVKPTEPKKVGQARKKNGIGQIAIKNLIEAQLRAMAGHVIFPDALTEEDRATFHKKYILADSRYWSLCKRSFDVLLNMVVYKKIILGNSAFDKLAECFKYEISPNDKETYLDAYGIFENDDLDEEVVSSEDDSPGMKKIRDQNKQIQKYLTENKQEIKQFWKNYKDYFPKGILNLNEFREFFRETGHDRACSYCDIKESEIKSLIKEKRLYTKRLYARGRTMEVDQIEPFAGYKLDNIGLCCYWCNNAKTDEFSEAEFKEIAKGIRVAWEARQSALSTKLEKIG